MTGIRRQKTESCVPQGGTPYKKRGIAATILLSSVFCLLPSAWASPPNSVQATYDIYKGSLKVGQIEETYTRDQDRYTLSSITTPVGLMAVFRPGRIIISSSGLVGEKGLQPLHFRDRREGDSNRDNRAEFDWNARQLSLIEQAQRVTVPLPGGTQDRLSAMYQFMFLLLQNVTAVDFPMTNGRKLDNYHYAVSPNHRIKTPIGEFDTLYLDNLARPGEHRTEIWLATRHHNLPCKMTVTDADGGQLTQVLSKLEMK